MDTTKDVPVVVDSWVTRYENLKMYMTTIGMPLDNLDDYGWIKMNIHLFCDSGQSNGILKQLKELHGH